MVLKCLSYKELEVLVITMYLECPVVFPRVISGRAREQRVNYMRQPKYRVGQPISVIKNRDCLIFLTNIRI